LPAQLFSLNAGHFPTQSEASWPGALVAVLGRPRKDGIWWHLLHSILSGFSLRGSGLGWKGRETAPAAVKPTFAMSLLPSFPFSQLTALTICDKMEKWMLYNL
jgi:hypothetical protein